MLVKSTILHGKLTELVKEAKDPGYALFVVSKIELDRTDPQHPRANGGICRVINPISLSEQRLKPISYLYKIDWSQDSITVNPYLRPLYDAMYAMLGFDKAERLMDREIIEIAPLAYMRGRTLSNSFIIMDEGQNTTKEQMKMFLTRMGFNSFAVINGDLTQIDLPNRNHSGLRDALEILQGTEGIGFTSFSSKDVIRHPLVKKIVDAYDRQGENKS